MSDIGILCPTCEYDLRGAAEPRCPECGTRFTWFNPPNPATFVHPYLFEHHPERNVWSFFKTLVGGLRARRFWRTLHRDQLSSPKRLITYWLIILTTYLTALAGLLAAYGIQRAGENEFPHYQILHVECVNGVPHEIDPNAFARYGDLQSYADEVYPDTILGAACAIVHERWFPIVAFLNLVVVIWPWITTLCSLWLAETSTVRPVHRIRVAIYCSDSILCTSASVLLALSVEAIIQTLTPYGLIRPADRHKWLMKGVYCFFAISSATWFYRLVVANRWYLEDVKAVINVFISQLCGVLVVAFVLIILAQTLLYFD